MKSNVYVLLRSLSVPYFHNACHEFGSKYFERTLGLTTGSPLARLTEHIETIDPTISDFTNAKKTSVSPPDPILPIVPAPLVIRA